MKAKIIRLFFMIVICFYGSHLTVNANQEDATVTEDGISVAITTDKDSYSNDEEINAIITLINTNDYDLVNITLNNYLPENLEFSTQEDSLILLKQLNTGESYEYHINAIHKVNDISNKNLIFILIVTVVLLSVLVAVLIFKKKSLKFIGVLILLIMVFTKADYVNASNLLTIEINKLITFDKETLFIKSVINYERTIDFTYEVVFKDYDGSIIKTETVDYGCEAIAPDNPTREGYTFISWNTTYNKIISDVEILAEYQEKISEDDTTLVTDSTNSTNANDSLSKSNDTNNISTNSNTTTTTNDNNNNTNNNDDDTSTKEQECLAILNQARNSSGLLTLEMDEELQKAAQIRAEEIVTLFSHTRPDGSECFSVSNKAMAENIAMGALSAEEVYHLWYNSEGHRRNMFSNQYSTIGIASFEYNGAVYWVQLFGK